MRFDALIFDFDGVLLESEWAGNAQIADWLTARGHPTSVEESMREFMGLAGLDFLGAIERWIGRAAARRLPCRPRRGGCAGDRRGARGGRRRGRLHPRACRRRCPRRSARPARPTGSTAISRNLGLEGAFGEMIFSGREHVARGKPAPDLYLHAAAALGVPIERTRDHRGFAGRRRRRARLGRDGDRPRRRPPLPARPRGAAARARASATSPAISTRSRALAGLELVPAAVALGGEIGAVVGARAGFERHPLGHLDPSALERRRPSGDCW